jgi:sporulation protein YlmC with PRC-barrel domain
VVQNEKVTLDVDRDPVLKGLDNGQRVQGAEVMTDDGRKIGTVRDMLIDDRTGEIKSYAVNIDDGNAVQSVPSDSVVSMGREILYISAASAAAATRAAPTAALGVVDGEGATVVARRKASREAGEGASSSTVGQTTTSEPAMAAPVSPVDKLVSDTMAATSGLADMMGGMTMNTRLLFGIVILVLGILILVYPALLPLIAGIALIVIGLWVALQNSSGARS